MGNINSEVYTDISIIIGMMPDDMKNKISSSFIKFIEENKSRDYVSNINPKIPLKEQEIRKETKEVLGIIYRDYLCEDKKRNDLIRKEQMEIKEFEEELSKKYNVDNMFKNKEADKNFKIDSISDKMQMKEYKESIFKRIINKVLKVLHIK